MNELPSDPEVLMHFEIYMEYTHQPEQPATLQIMADDLRVGLQLTRAQTEKLRTACDEALK